MNPTSPPHPVTFGAGAFFLLAGLAFLLDELGVAHVRPGVLWPLLLIASGLATIAQALVRQAGDPDRR